MINSGLKKYAEENGLKIAHGIAYGNLKGFAATLSEGSNYKQIVFSTRFSSEEQKSHFINAVNTVDIKRTYRVQNLEIWLRTIHVAFTDTVGTMKKLAEFVDWFVPMLRQYGAAAADICAECGMETASGRWVMVNGIAYYMHDACAEKVSREISDENIKRKEESTGSYLTGSIGALLGASIGAIAWAIVLNLGYVASLVGFLIGWLAEKGYNLLKGKQGKAKIVILILAVIFGVLMGNFAADAFTLFGMISNGELPGYSVGDIPGMIMLLMVADGEYLAATAKNVLIGLLFAGLGVFSLLRKAGRDVADQKFVELQ